MPARKKPSQADIAKAAGISMKSLRNWRDREGLDITNLDDVLHRAGKHPSAAGGETWSEARRRRAVADADRAEILAAREAGKVVELAEAMDLFQRIALELKGRLMALRGELVTQLEGLPPPEIYRVLDESFRDLLDAIHERRPIPPPS